MQWRRGRDSNPRYRFRYTRFPVAYLQPLGHLSALNSLSMELARTRPAVATQSSRCASTIAGPRCRRTSLHSREAASEARSEPESAEASEAHKDSPARRLELRHHLERRPASPDASAQSALAEREGFEPSIGFPLCRFSKPVPSASSATSPRRRGRIPASGAREREKSRSRPAMPRGRRSIRGMLCHSRERA